MNESAIRNIIKNSFLRRIKHSLRYAMFYVKWSKFNKRNDIEPQNIFPIECVQIGRYSYGELNVVTFNNILGISSIDDTLFTPSNEL